MPRDPRLREYLGRREYALALDLIGTEAEALARTEDGREAFEIARTLAAYLGEWEAFVRFSNLMRAADGPLRGIGDEILLLLGVHRRAMAEHRLEELSADLPAALAGAGNAAPKLLAGVADPALRGRLALALGGFARHAGWSSAALALVKEAARDLDDDPAARAELPVMLAAIRLDRGQVDVALRAEANADAPEASAPLLGMGDLGTTWAALRREAAQLQGILWPAETTGVPDGVHAVQVLRYLGGDVRAEYLLRRLGPLTHGPLRRQIELILSVGADAGLPALMTTEMPNHRSNRVEQGGDPEQGAQAPPPEDLPPFAALAGFSRLIAASEPKTDTELRLLARIDAHFAAADSPRILAQIATLRAFLCQRKGDGAGAVRHLRVGWDLLAPIEDLFLKAHIADMLAEVGDKTAPVDWAAEAGRLITTAAAHAPGVLARRALLARWGRILPRAHARALRAARADPSAEQIEMLARAMFQLNTQDPAAISCSPRRDLARLLLSTDAEGCGIAALDYRGATDVHDISAGPRLAALEWNLRRIVEPQTVGGEDGVVLDAAFMQTMAEISDCLGIARLLSSVPAGTPILIEATGIAARLPFAALGGREMGVWSTIGLRHPVAQRVAANARTAGAGTASSGSSPALAFVFAEPVRAAGHETYPALPQGADEEALLRRMGWCVAPRRSSLARKAALVDALRIADRVHVTGHGHFSPTSPAQSFLAIPDAAGGASATLTLSEIMGVGDIAAQELVLGTCSGVAAALLRDGRVVSLAGALVEAGVETVVAFCWPIRDQPASRIMMTYQMARTEPGLSEDSGQAAGSRVERIMASLLAVRRKLAEEGMSPRHLAALACLTAYSSRLPGERAETTGNSIEAA